MNLETLTIIEARRALDAKEYSALELTNAYLDAIEKKDGEIRAYLEVWADSAREEAKAADAIIAKGGSQPLTGIPIAVKDNILIEGRIASSASKILQKYVASYDATVIKKLKEQGVVSSVVPIWTNSRSAARRRTPPSGRRKTRTTHRVYPEGHRVARPRLSPHTWHSVHSEAIRAALFDNHQDSVERLA